MLKCEKCGIEYPSEVDFHQRGAGGSLVCLQCHQSSSSAQEGEGAAGDAGAGGEVGTPHAAATETTGEGGKPAFKVSWGGLIAAAIFLVIGVIAIRDPDMGIISLGYFGAALTLGIRSFTGGMTWGRGILTCLGGMCAGFSLIAVGIGDQIAVAIGPGLITFALLWYGFKRGPFQGRKKG